LTFLLNVPFITRVSVLVRRGDLDQQLAAGIDPRANAALALRARQLCTPRTRRRIAGQLRRTIAVAGRGSSGCFRFVPMARGEIIEETDALLDLANRLEAPRPAEAMGVALAKMLVADANSPLAVGAEPGTLHTVVGLATVALDVSPRRPADGK
jgi:hypothetical protein